MPKLISVAIIATVTALLAGCASKPKTFFNQYPAADFSTYHTFGFPRVLGTDDRENYTSLLSKYLIAATSRELEARGYKRSDAPDLLVDFALHTKEKIRTTSTPTTGAYYGGYRGYGGWGGYAGYETQVTQYTEGTLSIALVDAKKNQLVWEGIAQGRIDDNARENLQSAVDQVVSLLFESYPHRAGQANAAIAE